MSKVVKFEVDTDVSTLQQEKIALRLLISIPYVQQMQVREIRNEDSIRSVSSTSHKISVEEHLQWIARLETDSKQIVFAIINEAEKVIGLISLNALDLSHKKSLWSFFLSSSVRGGLGKVLEYHFIEFVFNIVKLEKLNGEVFEGNEYVLALHSNFFFVEEGFKRSDILQEGIRKGIYLVGLTRNDWLENRLNVLNKYHTLISKYNVEILYG